MNFKHKITVIFLYNLYNMFKVHVVWLVFFYKFVFNILVGEISSCLLKVKKKFCFPFLLVNYYCFNNETENSCWKSCFLVSLFWDQSSVLSLSSLDFCFSFTELSDCKTILWVTNSILSLKIWPRWANFIMQICGCKKNI